MRHATTRFARVWADRFERNEQRLADTVLGATIMGFAVLFGFTIGSLH
jgi:hypothetical protein